MKTPRCRGVGKTHIADNSQEGNEAMRAKTLSSLHVFGGLILTLALGHSAVAADDGAASPTQAVTGHPRLYFKADDLPRLRALRTEGVHARIWANLAESADWCARQTPRTEWIPT